MLVFAAPSSPTAAVATVSSLLEDCADMVKIPPTVIFSSPSAISAKVVLFKTVIATAPATPTSDAPAPEIA